MKRCCTCKQDKPESDFGRDKSAKDGLNFRCRVCANAHMRDQNRKKRLQPKVEYARTTEPTRCGSCKVIKPASDFGTDRSQPGGLNRSCKVCRANNRDIERQLERTQRHRQKYPERYRARSAINKAVQRGLIPHPAMLPCHFCSRLAAQYHHHLGYSREYRYHVIPVCVDCHERLDHELIPVPILDVPPVYVPRRKR